MISLSIITILVSVFLSSIVSANPVPADEAPGLVFIVFALLFLLNLPVNLFWYSAGVLILHKVKMLRSTRTPGFFGTQLSRKVAGAAALVTVFGALIDMYSAGEDVFWFEEIGEAAFIALGLVFASVLLVSLAIPRLRVAPSAMMAGGMAIMNLIHWTIIASIFYEGGVSRENPAPFVVMYGIVCAVMSVFVLWMISRATRQAPGPEVVK